MPSLFHSYQTTPEASETSQLRARIMELEAKLQAEQSRSSYWRDAFMRLKSNREKTEAESKNATATVPATKAYDQAEQDRHSFLFPKWTGSFHEHISASDHRVGVFDQDISVSDQDLAQERELELAKPFHRLRETPFTFDLREVQTGKLSRLTAREQDAQSLHTLMRNTPQRVSKERRHEEKSRLLVGAHGRGIREHTHSRRMDAVTARKYFSMVLRDS